MNRIRKITTIFIIVLSAALSFAVPAAAAKLDSPKKAKITGKTETTISISWEKVENAAKYTVYYSTSKKKDYKAYGFTTQTSMTLKNLYAGTKYWIYVRAVDENGAESGYNKLLSAITNKSNDTAASGTLKVTSAPDTVKNNDIATLKAVGKPNTEYKLTVYYSTKASKAKGTGKATSDADGNVSWSWKVGTKTKAGTHKIVIEGGGEKIETSFVTKK